MPSKPPTLSQHRLQRFHRWAMLWLTWFVGFLDGASAFAPLSKQARAMGHAWLDTIEQLIVNIVILRAMPFVRTLNAAKHAQRRRNDNQIRRAIIGGAMRRALRSKDLRQRIAALSQDIEALVARLLKRLPRGLTRRRPILARLESHQAPRLIQCAAPHACAAFAADTS